MTMTMTCRSAWIVAVVAALAGAAGDEPAAPGGVHAADLAKEPAPPPPDLHPKAPEPVPPEALEATIRRGVAFLLEDQNKDGSWGSPELTGVEIIAGIGSHPAFGTAVTALCTSALIEVDDGSEAVGRAIDRGEESLFRELPRVRRDDP